ncbi:MAG: 2OG-Fe(II) oxygenase [Gammaproteobacteria bacterium]
MSLLDLNAFADTPLVIDPFDYTVVPGFLRAESVSLVRRDFPVILYPGLLPLAETDYGPGFAALIDELRSAEVAAAFSEKFGVDLSERPLMITVRGRCQPKDGRIHTDTESKLVTGLLYLNDSWEADGGRLRLLRGPNDLDDMIAEVPPNNGTLVAFRRGERSYHGHKPYEGVRRYVMFNWMTEARAAAREVTRHRISARIKRWTAA